MTFNHSTTADTGLFTSTPPPLVSTKKDPRSSNPPITTGQYSLLLRLQQRYTSPPNFTTKPPNNRSEFAIAIQSIVDRIEDSQLAISPPDLAAIEELKIAFAPELATLPNRETRKKSADLFANSQIDIWGQSCVSNCVSNNHRTISPAPAKISNTQPAEPSNPTRKTTYPIGTKLSGEVLLSGVAIGGNPIPDDDNNDRRVAAGYRARLNINTSFTGFDRLRVRFQKSDLPAVNRVTGSDMSRLSYQGNTRGRFVLNRLEYRFPIDNKTEIFATAKGGNLATFGDSLNPHLDSGSEGTISRFGVRNPIYRQGRGAGFGITHKLGSSVTLGLGYLADDIDRLETGLFGGAYGAIAQITYKPNPQFGIGVNYIKSFNRLDTNTGSDRANDPFDDNSNAIAADAFGVQSSVQIAPNVYLGGWAGLTRAQAIDLPGNPTANIFNWAATLSFVDISGKDSLAGIIIGQPPKVTSNQFTANGASYSDPDTSLHLEAFYRWPIAENIATTAGILIITNPDHNAANDTTYVGVIRTLLEF
ncbi:iron uptake porin [Chamaesiphon polymorphus]|uniref:Carbohydrate porin n=1 Tax=Chamaesiphon polymorphus CCALA 037 TaxID=2107692 RepID=A0A2T1GA95_9CYAN|nr:iron uptake porin [Chamaesiphon polymorphus]PSB54182.1 carbohydrate porin [Chamaesiphon polymorphus CCALA 037]